MTSRWPAPSISTDWTEERFRCCSSSAARCSSRAQTGFTVELVPWHLESRFRLPVSVWRELMDAYFPNSGWLRLSLPDPRPAAALQGGSGPADVGGDDRDPVEASRGGPVTTRQEGAVTLDDRLAGARQVADAVLYEGYVLYPYRASARKNQMRWQFGVLAPDPFVASGDSGEASSMQTEMIVEASERARLHLRVRALQVQARMIERLDPDGGFRPVATLDTPDAAVDQL